MEFTALSTGNDACYKVERTVPEGWTNDWPYGTGIDPFWGNCERLAFGEQGGASFQWVFERTDPNATDQPVIEFELYATRNPAPAPGLGTLVGSRSVTLNVGLDFLHDVNNDGFITPADALYIINRRNSEDTLADVNVDGVVDSADAEAVIGSVGQTRE